MAELAAGPQLPAITKLNVRSRSPWQVAWEQISAHHRMSISPKEEIFGLPSNTLCADSLVYLPFALQK